MGRDHEFLEAARNGNISLVEKFLNQKSKKNGPLASLRRGPGVNVQDSNGYSALHHSALNGHIDIVKLLLAHDALANLPDSRGSSPLHLAAWAGHQEIVKIFLTHPYNSANVNLQTIEKETPLHCAAQYGHTGALTTLLAHGGDPNMTNCRNETPLDLAAQYGRLQAVQMLIRAHPELLLPYKNSILLENNENSSFCINKMQIGGSGCGGAVNNITNCSNNGPILSNGINGSSSSNFGDGSGNNGIGNSSRCNSRTSHASSCNTEISSTGNYNSNNKNSNIIQSSYLHTHTPLHLASRNGHKNVVEVLLAAGIDANILTSSGTALHEAALCGKDNVVRTLLDSGADLDATDSEGRTPLDILEEFPPHVTRSIVSVINNYKKSLAYDSESDDVHRCNQKSNNYNSSNMCYMTTPMSLGSSYETNRISPIQNYSSSHYDITTSPSSSMGSLGPPSPSPRFHPSNDDIPPELYNNTKRQQITSNRGYNQFHHHHNTIGLTMPITTSSTTNLKQQSSRKSTAAPKKPPRRNLSISPTRLLSSSSSINNQISNYITVSINDNNSSPGSNHTTTTSSSKLSSYGGGYNNYIPTSFKGKSTSSIKYNKSSSIGMKTIEGIVANSKNPQTVIPSSTSTTIITSTSINDKDKFRSYSADQCINNISSNRNYRGIYELNLLQAKSNSIKFHHSNATLRSYNPNRKLKRNRDSFERFNIDFNKDKAYYEGLKNCPQSPTNYQQPPTPEHPPPTPSQAEKFIYERIRPLNQEYKRRSALLNSLTIESGTSTSQDGLCSSFRASSGSISSSFSISDRSMSTDCVEEYVEDIPFAGLFKGSIMNLDNSYLYYSNSNNQIDNNHHIGGAGAKYFMNRCEIQLPLLSQIPKHGQRSHSFSGVLDQNLSDDNDDDYNDYNINNYYKINNDNQLINSFDNNDIIINDYEIIGNSYDNNINDDIINYDKNDIMQSNNEQKFNNVNDDDDNIIKKIDNNDGNDRMNLQYRIIKKQKNNKRMISATSPSNSANNTKSTTLINNIDEKNLNESDMIVNKDEEWSKIAEIMETFGKNSCQNKNPPNKYDDNNQIEIDDKTMMPIKMTNTNTTTITTNSTTNTNTITTTITTGCENNQLHNILANWNLLYLENKFIENGYDNIKFMNGLIDGNDLLLMNIPMNEHDLIMNMIKTLPKSEPLPILYSNNNNNSILSVDQWLENIDLNSYKEDFRKHLYTNMEMVCQVWEVELQTVIEIKKLGHRKRILYSVSSNRKPPPPKKATTTINEISCDLYSINAQNNININKNNDNIKTTISTLTISTTTTSVTSTIAATDTLTPTTATVTALGTTTHSTSNKSNVKLINATNTNNNKKKIITSTVGNPPPVIIQRHGNRKNRPAPKPPIKPTSPLEIRAPSELLLGLPSNLRTQWRHNASALVCNTVKYDVYYLGSTIVKELRGTESTRKSIQKLKRDNRIISTTNQIQQQQQQQEKSQQNNKQVSITATTKTTTTIHENQINTTVNAENHRSTKRRPIRLQISNRGVEFIDIETEKLICVHEIRNINCACQDADDLSHFAYITKDSDNMTYYCHVFNVSSMDLATEIILTLGQAFEVAYQLALQGTITSINLQSSSKSQQKQQEQIKDQQQNQKQPLECQEQHKDEAK